jgi:hypothetical protein
MRYAEGGRLRIIKGWKKLSHECGYLNDNSGQTVVVSRKEFSKNFYVRLFDSGHAEKDDGKTISPEYATKTKADAFAHDWMQKHPNGTT